MKNRQTKLRSFEEIQQGLGNPDAPRTPLFYPEEVQLMGVLAAVIALAIVIVMYLSKQ